jgi:hypothetical protein
MTTKENEVIWYKNIYVLTQNINQIWPQVSMTPEEQINSITRLLVIVTILGYLATGNLILITTGLLFIGIVSVYGYAKTNGTLKTMLSLNTGETNSEIEGFIPNMNNEIVEDNIKTAYNLSKQSFNNKYEKPTPDNPLSNVLLTDIHDNPMRNPAPPSYLKSVENEINENTMEMIKNENPDITDIDKRLFTEVGDNFTFDRGMRQFYSMPNTQVPNDQAGFAEFCYGTMISCKEGHEIACHRNAYRHLPGY